MEFLQICHIFLLRQIVYLILAPSHQRKDLTPHGVNQTTYCIALLGESLIYINIVDLYKVLWKFACTAIQSLYHLAYLLLSVFSIDVF